MTTIMTVRGAKQAEKLGVVLPHEHIMSTFGLAAVRYPTYDREALLAAAVPYLKHLKTLGCGTVADATAAYFGRHPELLREISEQADIHILSNTGYYAAANDRYVPEHAYGESVDTIARRWIQEYEEGIDETGIIPGFIKTAADPGPLSAIDEKLLRAAAATHLATGLPIQTHLGDNIEAARFILALLRTEKVYAMWTWVHAHAVQNVDHLLEACDQGAWVSLDGLNESSSDRILELLFALKDRGYLNQALLSHDGETYDRTGGSRPFHYLLTDFVPKLRQAGFSPEDVNQLTVDNPRRAFTIGAPENPTPSGSR